MPLLMIFDEQRLADVVLYLDSHKNADIILGEYE